MKPRIKQLILFALLVALIITLPGCGKDKKKAASGSTMTVTFLDVGQGDCALIECDGEYMLIDAGPKGKSREVQRYLLQENIRNLKYLALSHLDEDHIGGILKDALVNVSIDCVLSNQKISSNIELSAKLAAYKQIIPQKGDTYRLGSATVEVISVRSSNRNDSLVLMIKHGKTRFIFTGDMESEQQKEVADAFLEISNELKKSEVLLKMPHHGAYNIDRNLPAGSRNNYLLSLINHSYASYFVISVGNANSHGHPDEDTLDLINIALSSNDLKERDHLLRTDKNGTIVFTSNTKKITLTGVEKRS